MLGIMKFNKTLKKLLNGWRTVNPVYFKISDYSNIEYGGLKVAKLIK